MTLELQTHADRCYCSLRAVIHEHIDKNEITGLHTSALVASGAYMATGDERFRELRRFCLDTAAIIHRLTAKPTMH